MTSIFGEQDYRIVLRKTAEARKAIDPGYGFQEIAHAARIQKSYLSRVFSLKVHLNSDQLYLAADHLKFSEPEREFLGLLLEHERSVVPRRRKELSQQIDDLRSMHLATGTRIRNQTVQPTNSNASEFFEDPWLAIVYRCLFLTRFQRNPAALSQALSISDGKVFASIRRLQQLGAVIQNGQRVIAQENRFHLPPNHRLYPIWRNELRLLSALKLSTHPDEKKYSFSAVCVASHECKIKIRARFLEFLEEIEPWVTESENEEVFQINFDLFGWLENEGLR